MEQIQKIENMYSFTFDRVLGFDLQLQWRHAFPTTKFPGPFPLPPWSNVGLGIYLKKLNIIYFLFLTKTFTSASGFISGCAERGAVKWYVKPPPLVKITLPEK